MKPLMLKMSAWGSYPEETQIDFTRFHEGSLFLVTGPTGAGKTTVFDAISFALYGDVSGKLREKSSVRSDFAKDDIDTYVELTFTHKDQIYTIRRTPKYERPKKRGVGYTTSNETAEFYRKDQSPFTVIADVNKKVEEILGINYDQFKQIAMIAQGEFLELLISNSKDRVEIFRNLFQTGQYEKVQRILSLKANKLYQNSCELKNKIEEAITAIDVVDNEELSTLLDAENYQYEKLIELTKNDIKEEKNKIHEYEKQINEAEQSTNKQIVIITEGEALGIKLDELDKVNKEIKELELQKDTINLEEERIQKASYTKKVVLDERLYLDAKKRVEEITNKLDVLNEEIIKFKPEYEQCKIEYEKNDIRNEKIEEYQNRYSKLEELVPLFKELEELEQLLKQHQDKLMTLSKKQELMKNKIEDCILQKQNCLEEIKQYVNFEENISENKVKTVKQERIHMDMKEALSKIINLSKEKIELKKLQDIYEVSEKELKIKKEMFEKKEDIYKKAAVGLAARYLVDNMPCPVCGSLEHPKKAIISNDIPDEKQIEELKQAFEKSQDIYHENYLAAAKQNGIVLSKESEIKSVLELLQVDNEEKLLEQITLTKKELDSLLEERKYLEQGIIRKNSIEKQLIELEIILDAFIKETDRIQQEYLESKSKTDLLQGRKSQMMVKLPKNITNFDVENEMTTIKDEVDILKNNKKQIEITYQKIKSLLENNSALYEDTKISYNNRSEEENLLKNKYLECLVSNGFETEDKYQNAKLPEKDLEGLEKYVKDYYEIRQTKFENKKNLEADINKRERVDVIYLREQLTELNNQKTIMRKKKEQIAARIIGNKRALDSITSKLSLKKEIEEEYGVVKDLDNVTKGNNKERLVFEQYVLSSYFEDIIASANLRLSKMTNSRYELMKVSKVADARTKDSLDLEVLDYYTGKIRSIKTLSGGESFKAALSLALGLSDIVQNNAGGIEIETLFIDEGFGSLDSESLDQALNTLTSLTEHNRLIGIISHVNELKERIDNQIVVEKGNHGSKLKLVF